MKLGVIFQGRIIFHIFVLQHMVPVMVEVAELKIISSKIHGWNMNQTPQLRFCLVLVVVVVLHIIKQSI